MNKLFCTQPFSKIFLGADGTVKTCCASSDYSIGNIKENTIEEILQGEKAKKIRQELIEGKWPEQCTWNCKKLYDVGAKGEIESNDYFAEQALEKGNLYFELNQIDLRWSNLCNLSCTYCSPAFSSKWAALKKIKINNVSKDNVDSLLNFIKEDINSKNSILKIVYLLGGEPLLLDKNIELLKLIKDIDVTVHITTNLTNKLSENEISNLLLERNNVKWAISMETLREKFEYVREGGEWSIFDKNIDYLNHKKRDGAKYVLNPIYCIYSALSIVELYEYAESKNLDDVDWQIILQGPSAVSVVNLPKKQKLKAIEQINIVVDRYKDRFEISKLLGFRDNVLIPNLETSDINIMVDYHTKMETETLIHKKHKFIDLWEDMIFDE
jgi:radical SAM protein with 4Fe4S-binding SPASM domain